MSDTFAMNKVYEDDRWPWGDQGRQEKKLWDIQNQPCFSLFFGHPERVAQILRIIFRRWAKPKTKKERKMGQKSRTQESENAIFPWFCMPPKGRVNKRARGFFFDTARSTAMFLDPLFGVQFQRLSVRKRYYTTKIVVSALFRDPTNERKSSNFKS